MATEHPHYRERFTKSTVRSNAGKPLRKANVTAMVVLLATTAALVSSEARSNAISERGAIAVLQEPSVFLLWQSSPEDPELALPD